MGAAVAPQGRAQLYLPDPDQSHTEESSAFAHFRDVLGERGFSLGWQTTYNAGANPITLRLRAKDRSEPALRDFLAATYCAVQPGTVPGRRSPLARTTAPTGRCDRMASGLSWLDSSREDQQRMRELLKMFSEQESRDELGIGQIRDAFSDMLFPGTSVSPRTPSARP
jgi:hypothetical protein